MIWLATAKERPPSTMLRIVPLPRADARGRKKAPTPLLPHEAKSEWGRGTARRAVEGVRRARWRGRHRAKTATDTSSLVQHNQILAAEGDLDRLARLRQGEACGVENVDQQGFAVEPDS